MYKSERNEKLIGARKLFLLALFAASRTYTRTESRWKCGESRVGDCDLGPVVRSFAVHFRGNGRLDREKARAVLYARVRVNLEQIDPRVRTLEGHRAGGLGCLAPRIGVRSPRLFRRSRVRRWCNVYRPAIRHRLWREAFAFEWSASFQGKSAVCIRHTCGFLMYARTHTSALARNLGTFYYRRPIIFTSLCRASQIRYPNRKIAAKRRSRTLLRRICKLRRILLIFSRCC